MVVAPYSSCYVKDNELTIIDTVTGSKNFSANKKREMLKTLPLHIRIRLGNLYRTIFCMTCTAIATAYPK